MRSKKKIRDQLKKVNKAKVICLGQKGKEKEEKNISKEAIIDDFCSVKQESKSGGKYFLAIFLLATHFRHLGIMEKKSIAMR
jgi:hypothetical protein